eukprot:TRINITY_DN2169_c0_g1_i1.p1 TRINITY_DN2169_c0_g1~~TRINITY_DN2169_c0_g1_i1.p1  ORF type:complete len:249 (-),score=42.99 TRINITY_DN2169_c0_g1_i1:45-770(-)
MISERESLLFSARIAEQSDCFEEMITAMKKVIQLDPHLSVEERNLLSVGYKNIVGSKRASWRVVYSLEQKEKSKNPNCSWKLSQMSELKRKIEMDLNLVCNEILNLIEFLLSVDSYEENMLFWYKMKGDYYRYIAEFESGENRDLASKAAWAAYQRAYDSLHLECTNPILLGLCLNFSVFYYEIMRDKEKACSLAKECYDNALVALDSDSVDYKDTTLIMHLLRDNLNLWTTETSESSDDD